MYSASDNSISQDKSAVGLRTALSVPQRWGVTPEQTCRVLSISPSTYQRLGKDFDGLEPIDGDQLQRIQNVLNILAELRACLSNHDNVYGFLSMNNGNEVFGGRRPLDVIVEGGHLISASNLNIIERHHGVLAYSIGLVVTTVSHIPPDLAYPQYGKPRYCMLGRWR